MNRERNIFGEFRRGTARPAEKNRPLPRAEQALLDAAKQASHDAYMGAYRASLAALMAGEITREECDARRAAAEQEKRRKDRDAYEGVLKARYQKVALAA